MKNINLYLIALMLIVVGMAGCKQEDDFDLRIPENAKPKITETWTVVSGNATLRKGGRVFVTDSPLKTGQPVDINFQVTLAQTTDESKTLVGYKLELGHEPELASTGVPSDQGFEVLIDDNEAFSHTLSKGNPFVFDYHFNSVEIDEFYWGGAGLIGTGYDEFIPSEQVNIRLTFYFSDGTFIKLPQMSVFWVNYPELTKQK